MIDSTLLDQLQKTDPVTWKRFVDTELFTYNEYDDYGKIEHYVYQEDVIDVAKEAWLQHVLQDAISAKGWTYQITGYPNECIAILRYTTMEENCNAEYNIYFRSANQTKALLECYLAAIEAQP